MPTVVEVADQIQEVHNRLAAAFKSAGWPTEGALNAYHSYMPGYPVNVVLEYVTFTADRVRNLSDSDIAKNSLGRYLISVNSNVQLLTFGNLTSDPVTAVNGVMMTMQMINSRLPTEPSGPVKLDWESVEDKTFFPKDIARRLRDVVNRLDALEPRSAEVDGKIRDIEAAHEAAERLPEDLAELAAKRDEVSKIVSQVDDLLDQATKSGSNIEKTSEKAIDARQRMLGAEKQAEKLIEMSEQALRGSTGVGLANAFEKRKEGLTAAGTLWVVGLIAALIAAFFIGSDRVKALQTALTNESSPQIVWMNVILTIFGIGGPIWFAWLSTKQIAVNFKLAEDYAFKAAVSKAYEGYRKEAVEIDPALQGRLFASALDRLEEAPIRLMDKENHSSPLQELLANPAIRKSLEGIPGIADKIIALIPEKGGVAAVVGSTAAVAAAVNAEPPRPAPRARTTKTEDE